MKRLLVISDVHGSFIQLKKAIDVFNRGNYTYLVIAGDLYYHGPRNSLPIGYDPKACAELLNNYKDRILCVKGNCDAEVDQMISQFKMHDFLNIKLGKMSIYIDHGHKNGPDKPPLGDFNIYIFGHYHILYHRIRNRLLLLSPGSISLPKDKNPSYLVLDEKGFAEFYDINTDELIFKMIITN